MLMDVEDTVSLNRQQVADRASDIHADIVTCFYDLSLRLWTSDDWDAAFAETLSFLRDRLAIDRCALYLALPGRRAPRFVPSGVFPEDAGITLQGDLSRREFDVEAASKNYRVFPIRIRSGRSSYLILPADRQAQPHPVWVEAFCLELARILTAFNAVFRVRRQDRYEERAAISRELHDSLAQSLTYLKIQVSRLEASLKPSANGDESLDSDTRAIVRELRMRLKRAYRELRELMTTFRLTMHGKSFNLAVEELIKEYEQYSSIVFTLDNRLEEDCLSVEEEMQVLQIIREAVSNIVQHSKARHTDIHLDTDCDARVCVTISDDGVGLDKVQMRAQHHGLLIMQERAFSLDGRLAVDHNPDGGTSIHIRFKPSTNESAGAGSAIADTFV